MHFMQTGSSFSVDAPVSYIHSDPICYHSPNTDTTETTKLSAAYKEYRESLEESEIDSSDEDEDTEDGKVDASTDKGKGVSKSAASSSKTKASGSKAPDPNDDIDWSDEHFGMTKPVYDALSLEEKRALCMERNRRALADLEAEHLKAFGPPKPRPKGPKTSAIVNDDDDFAIPSIDRAIKKARKNQTRSSKLRAPLTLDGSPSPETSSTQPTAPPSTLSDVQDPTHVAQSSQPTTSESPSGTASAQDLAQPSQDVEPVSAHETQPIHAALHPPPVPVPSPPASPKMPPVNTDGTSSSTPQQVPPAEVPSTPTEQSQDPAGALEVSAPAHLPSGEIQSETEPGLDTASAVETLPAMDIDVEPGISNMEKATVEASTPDAVDTLSEPHAETGILTTGVPGPGDLPLETPTLGTATRAATADAEHQGSTLAHTPGSTVGEGIPPPVMRSLENLGAYVAQSLSALDSFSTNPLWRAVVDNYVKLEQEIGPLSGRVRVCHHHLAVNLLIQRRNILNDSRPTNAPLSCPYGTTRAASLTSYQESPI